MTAGTSRSLVSPSQDMLEAVRAREHEHCVMCGNHGGGFGLLFICGNDGVVEAEVRCAAALAGYSSTAHGGVVCSLLDAAMTNCLFAHGVAGVTADLRVQFRRPVGVERPLRVAARLVRAAPPRYAVEAWITQDGVVRASGHGRFIERNGQGSPHEGEQ